MPEVIAHRGASADAPENTLAAIAEARRQGADAVEVDVQRTADGVLVLHHDATPRRTTDAAAVYGDRADDPIGSFTLAELRALDAGAGERIPTLAELLEALGDLGALLELKDPWHYPDIGREVVAALAGRPAVVMSFDASAVRELAGSAVTVGQLLAAAPDAALLDDIATYAQLVTVDHRAMHADLEAAVRDRGLSPGVYTVNEGAEMRRMLDLGVDRIITDRPGVLGELLGARV